MTRAWVLTLLACAAPGAPPRPTAPPPPPAVPAEEVPGLLTGLRNVADADADQRPRMLAMSCAELPSCGRACTQFLEAWARIAPEARAELAGGEPCDPSAAALPVTPPEQRPAAVDRWVTERVATLVRRAAASRPDPERRALECRARAAGVLPGGPCS